MIADSASCHNRFTGHGEVYASRGAMFRAGPLRSNEPDRATTTGESVARAGLCWQFEYSSPDRAGDRPDARFADAGLSFRQSCHGRRHGPGHQHRDPACVWRLAEHSRLDRRKRQFQLPVGPVVGHYAGSFGDRWGRLRRHGRERPARLRTDGQCPRLPVSAVGSEQPTGRR